MADGTKAGEMRRDGVPVALDLSSGEIAEWIAAGYKNKYGGTLRVETVRAGTVENGNAWKVTGDILPQTRAKETQ